MEAVEVEMAVVAEAEAVAEEVLGRHRRGEAAEEAVGRHRRGEAEAVEVAAAVAPAADR